MSPAALVPICTPLHPIWAFDVLAAHLRHEAPADPPFHNPHDSYALFVSWHVAKPGRRHVLRGCIGNFLPMPLAEGVKDYALISALKDHRFSPIKVAELPTLLCDVSLLTPFVSIADPLDWTPGEHGIHITFTHPTDHTRSYSATYLPHICPEQGWTKEETVLSAISKAGYKGKVKVGDRMWKRLHVKIYGSVKVEASWQDYVEWKQSMSENGKATE
ncbi:hypothetical protein AYX13_02589 [Cryptococcus neoformans]|nr:hypothetical protein AYX13_02589 [Cryptococcus neoformans var. grubii]